MPRRAPAVAVERFRQRLEQKRRRNISSKHDDWALVDFSAGSGGDAAARALEMAGLKENTDQPRSDPLSVLVVLAEQGFLVSGNDSKEAEDAGSDVARALARPSRLTVLFTGLRWASAEAKSAREWAREAAGPSGGEICVIDGPLSLVVPSVVCDGVEAAQQLFDPGHTCRRMFVYGTLRPDADASSVPWSNFPHEGFSTQESAVLPASRLMFESYPFVVLDNDTDTLGSSASSRTDRPETGGTVGFVLGSEDDDAWTRKLAEADRIEGFPDFYVRAIAPVWLKSGVAVDAWVYWRVDGSPVSLPIPDGDFVTWETRRSGK
jgi:Gamma-glutamyl cyclotransferase, AIG2-like